jgi:hypothetical protein
LTCHSPLGPDLVAPATPIRTKTWRESSAGVGRAHLHQHLQHRQALADEAIALARDIGDDATIVGVLDNVCWSLAMPQLLARSLEWSAEAVCVVEAIVGLTLPR